MAEALEAGRKIKASGAEALRAALDASGGLQVFVYLSLFIYLYSYTYMSVYIYVCVCINI